MQEKLKGQFMWRFPAFKMDWSKKEFPGPPFKLASLPVQPPPTLKPLSGPWFGGSDFHSQIGRKCPGGQLCPTACVSLDPSIAQSYTLQQYRHCDYHESRHERLRINSTVTASHQQTLAHLLFFKD